MTEGRHAKTHSARAAVMLAIVAGVLLLTAGGAVAALHYDREKADTILPGVMVEGVDVGGMTRQEAIGAVERQVDRQLGSAITINALHRTWVRTPAQLGRQAQVSAAVDRALALSDSLGVFSRVWHRLRSDPLGKSVDVTVGGDAGVAPFVTQVAKSVAVDPIDASIMEKDGKLVFTKPKTGRALEERKSTRLLQRALAGDVTSVTLPTKAVRPDVTAKALGRTIVVRLDQNRLYLYQGLEVEKSFPVATAKPGFTTPVGNWIIDAKAVDPVWHNPALDSWGADEPAVVPGGPGNPMGPRALYLSAPGLIRIHGTNDEASIGHYASHGCIRMHNADVVRLYPLAPVGTQVIIVGSRPY
jgi:lipoprotein-anchoring transpeptidase ErfK/SrfK